MNQLMTFIERLKECFGGGGHHDSAKTAKRRIDMDYIDSTNHPLKSTESIEDVPDSSD